MWAPGTEACFFPALCPQYTQQTPVLVRPGIYLGTHDRNTLSQGMRNCRNDPAEATIPPTSFISVRRSGARSVFLLLSQEIVCLRSLRSEEHTLNSSH